jgi:uncharacterized OsmC-like protein
MSDDHQFSLSLERLAGYEFETRFDWERVPPLLLDEPEPLGGAGGPNASRLIGAAVGNCLSASLVFCLEKAKQRVKSIRADVEGTSRRNQAGRLRLAQLDVHITVDVEVDQPKRIERCLALFEDYCVVTASIKKGVQVNVLVTDPQGTELFREDGPPVEL